MSTRQSTTGGQHSFSNIPSAEISRSQFDRSCGLKTTFDSGLLIPIFADEALPGDTMNMKMSTFGRLSTPLHPIMDNIYMDFHFFSIPLRLVWDNFQRFMGEQPNPDDTTDFLVPQLVTPASPGGVNGELSDYFGIPTEVPDLSHSALFHRAYNLVWNEWFRDENLQDSVVVDKDDGPDTHADYSLLRRGKRKDYFTASLPWPQKGDSVALPLGTSAPLDWDTNAVRVLADSSNTPTFTVGGESRAIQIQGSGSENANWSGGNAGGATESAVWATPSLAVLRDDLELGVADLSSATAATINQIRQAFQIQRLYERDARGGTRYVEILRSHFGITNHPDARLQRPEYLGGGTQQINVSAVPQTSSTDGTSPQGNLAAYGTTSGSGVGFSKSFVEHSLIIGFCSVRADLNYQQGLPRMFSRSTRWDFFWPALQHLGEQSILNKEIYAQGSADATADAATFGYQERYAEYRYKPSQITGQMRSNYSTPLDTWHLAQDFSVIPVLDDTFIQENPPIARIVAVTSEPEFLLDAFFKYKCARPMPTYSVPGMIDHF